MIKFEAPTLEKAMEEATRKFNCSVTELQIEVIQHPSSGFLGVMKKAAIIVAIKKSALKTENPSAEEPQGYGANQRHPKSKPERPRENYDRPREVKSEQRTRDANGERSRETPSERNRDKSSERTKEKYLDRSREKNSDRPREKTQTAAKTSTPNRQQNRPAENKGFISSRSDIITPTSLVTAQEDYEDMFEENEYVSQPVKETAYKPKEDIRRHIAKEEAKLETIKRINSDSFNDNVTQNFFQSSLSLEEKIEEIERDINNLFSQTCFDIDPVMVSKYDEESVLVEFTGTDAALLIGKEGYRYKALSYMLFNWINSKYDLQLRLEIAEFLRNQEEMIRNYLVGVCAQVDRDGRAQTKILDGVLVQIALKELRTHYPEKYVAIRTNRDGLKYVIINSFRSSNG